MKPEDKLIVKHVLKSVLIRIEYDRDIQEELSHIGIEYTQLTQREIIEEPHYIELMSKFEKLIKL